MPHTLYKLDVLTSPTSKRWIKSSLIIFLKVGPKLREISTPTQPDLLPSPVKMQTTHKTYGLLPPCEVLSSLAELGGGWWTSGWSSFHHLSDVDTSHPQIATLQTSEVGSPPPRHQKKKGEEKPKKYTTEEGWFSPTEVNIPTLKLPRKKPALWQEMKSSGWDFNSGKEMSFLRFLVFRAAETRTTY